MAVSETGHEARRTLDDLFRAHGARVYRYSLAVLANHADAEDVTQTTFLSAYRALEQGARPRKPESWLLAIASNAIKQRYRQESARPRQVELDDEVADAGSEEDGPTVGELLAALAKIPPLQRQAIVLREFEGRSYKEIAEILGVTHSALETLLFRARRSLAEELETRLTCTDAQLAISRAADERLGRKERRRLREHLGECPDCARFARLQQRHRRALKGLMLVPVPVSLSLLRGVEGTAAAATLPAAASVAATASTATVVGAGVGTVATGTSAGAAGGSLLGGGLALKAAAVVSAAAVTTGVGVTGASEIAPKVRGDVPASTKPAPPQTPGKGLGNSVARRAVSKTRPAAFKHGARAAEAQASAVPGRQVASTRRATTPSRNGAARGTSTATSRRAVKSTSGTQPGTRARPAARSRARAEPAGRTDRPARAAATSPVKPAKPTEGRGTGRRAQRVAPPAGGAKGPSR